MPLVQAKADTRIWVDEDHDNKDVSEDFVGRKAKSLFLLKDLDAPVPPFFAISGNIFTEYIKECLGHDITNTTSDDDIRNNIEKGSFEIDVRNEIMEGYSRLSGFSDAWVSVRSSIVLPTSHRNLTCAGLLDTVLNARGLDDVLHAIQNVYASAFSGKTAEYLSQNNLSIADIKVGIVVQKMVQAEAAGVLYTVDPVTQDDKYLTIEAVFGLGNVIADGEITPDQYTVDKKSLEFKEKKIVPQEWMIVRTMKKKEGESGEQKVQISKSWQQQPKIENRYIEELTKLGVRIEKKLQEPQDIEWVFEGGRIWLLQTSDVQPVIIPAQVDEPILAVEPAIIEAAQKLVEKEESRQRIKESMRKKKKEKEKKEEKVFTEKPLARQILDGATKKKPKTKKDPIVYNPLPGEKLLITGIGSSKSSFRGKVVVITSPKDLEIHKKLITKKSVLVFSDFFPQLDRFLTRVGAIISDSGGMTSDISTRCRERGIPCVAGCHIASKMLHHGESVLVDGTIGAIYGMRDSQEMQKVTERIQSTPEPRKLKKKEKPSEPEKERTETAEKKEAPTTAISSPIEQKVVTATKIYLDISDSYARGSAWKNVVSKTDGVCLLEIDDVYKKIGRHPEAFVEDGNRTEIVKLIADSVSEVCEAADGEPVFVSIGNGTVTQYKSLTKGSQFEKTDNILNESSRGLLRLLAHPKELNVFFGAVRRVRNVDGWRNLSIAIHYAGTPGNLVELKKLLSSANLRRSSTFNVHLAIDTPSESMIVGDFIDKGIDGVIINTSNLAKHMMASSPEDESILKMIRTVKGASAGTQSILQITSDSEKLIKEGVSLGFHGLAIQPKLVKGMKETVADLERKAVLKH